MRDAPRKPDLRKAISTTLEALALHQWPHALLFLHGGDQNPGNGCLKLSDRPGIGFEGQARLYRIMKELAA